MMRKLTALLLVLTLCFTLCACSARKGEEEASAQDATVNATLPSDVTEEGTTESGTAEELTTEPLTTEDITTEPVTSGVQKNEDVTSPSQPVITPDVESEGIKPILYKVSDANGNVIWLFGSIHVGREDFYPLPDYVMNAYNSSDAVAVEFNILEYQSDLFAQTKSMKSFLYTDGSKISDHISEEVYNAGVAALTEYGMYTSLLDRCRPALWSSLIDALIILEIGTDANLGVDMQILNMADRDGKEIRDIESADFQYDMLASFSDELQEMMLVSSLKSMTDIEGYAEDMDMLLDLWASGDEAAFSEYLNGSDEVTGMSQELYDEYYTAMITNRNKTMTDYAVNALASGEEIFICVGAAHVVGEGAMAENLRELGYTVEVVS